MKLLWQLTHHLVAHPLIGISFGRPWAWHFHDWTAGKAWQGDRSDPVRWAGLE